MNNKALYKNILLEQLNIDLLLQELLKKDKNEQTEFFLYVLDNYENYNPEIEFDNFPKKIKHKFREIMGYARVGYARANIDEEEKIKRIKKDNIEKIHKSIFDLLNLPEFQDAKKLIMRKID